MTFRLLNQTTKKAVATPTESAPSSFRLLRGEVDTEPVPFRERVAEEFKRPVGENLKAAAMGAIGSAESLLPGAKLAKGAINVAAKGFAKAGNFRLLNAIYGQQMSERSSAEEHPVSRSLGAIVGSLGPYGFGLKATRLATPALQKAIAGMGLPKRAFARGVELAPIAMAENLLTTRNEAERAGRDVPLSDYWLNAGISGLSAIPAGAAAELIGAAAKGAGAGIKRGVARATRQTAEQVRPKRTVIVDSAKIRSIFGTGDEISPEELDLVKGLGLHENKGWKKAFMRGVEIEVPEERIVTISDRPWFAKVKSAFRIKPGEVERRVISEGKPQLAGFPGSQKTPAAAPPIAEKPLLLPDGRSAVVAKQLWEMTRKDVSEDVGMLNVARQLGRSLGGVLDLHRSAVQKAISEGKPVPPEVLAEYPDLAAGRSAQIQTPAPEGVEVSSARAEEVKARGEIEKQNQEQTPAPAADPNLVAYREKPSYDPQTGAEGVLRDEWRVREIGAADGPTYDEIRAALGPRAAMERGNVILEHRYIRRGVEEQWTPVDAYSSRQKALEELEEGVTAVAEDLKMVQKAASDKAEADRIKAEEQAAAEAKRQEEAQRLADGREAFRRLLAGKDAIWAKRWNEFMVQRKDDADFRAVAGKDAEFKRLHDEAVYAKTVPTKRAAIKAFLKYANERYPMVPSSPAALGSPKAARTLPGGREQASLSLEPEALLDDAVDLNAELWQIKLPLEPTTPKRINKSQIIRQVEKMFKVPVRGKLTHRMKKAVGFYTNKQLIRLRRWGDLEVLTHETAHRIDDLIERGLGSGLFKKGRTIWYIQMAPPGQKQVVQTELANLDYDQNERRMHEGFAEYMRHWLTGTGQAESRAPIFHDLFHNKFLAQHPQLKKDIYRLRDMYSIWKEQGAEARLLSHIDFKGEHTRKPMIEQARAGLQTVYSALVDEMAILRDIEKQAGLEVGKNMRPSESPYALATYMKAKASGIARYFVEEAAVDEHGRHVGPSLVDVLKPIDPKQLNRFIGYWVARQASYLVRRGIETGLDVGDIKYYLEKTHNDTWDKVAKDLTSWSDNILNWLIRSGGLDERSAEIFRQLNPIYAPFMRVFHDELGVFRGAGRLFSAGKAIKSRKGSGRPIINPVESMASNVAILISKAHKMRLANAIIKMANKHELGGIADRIPLAKTPMGYQLQQIYYALKKSGLTIASEDDFTGELVDIKQLDDSEDIFSQFMTLFADSIQVPGHNSVVPIFRHGKLQLYEIHPDLYKALQAVEPLKLEPTLQVLSMFTKLKRLGSTGLNTTWGVIRNPYKDMKSFLVYTRNKFQHPLSPLMGTILDVISAPGTFAQRFKAAGGDISSMMGYDRAQVQTALDQALLKNLGAKGKVLKVVKNPVDALRRLINIFEMGPRVAEGTASMKRIRKEHPDWTDEDVFIAAFNEAQDITTNFSRSGSWGKRFNMVSFAFNAANQGIDKFSRAMQENPVRTVVMGTAWLSLPSLYFWFINKDKDWYKNLDLTHKLNNIFIEFDDEVLRLPIPHDLGVVFSALSVALADGIYNENPEYINAMMELIIAQMPSIMPDMIGPAWEVARNKTYLGTPIETKGMQALPVPNRIRHDTPKYAQLISEGFNRLGHDISPVQVEHLVNSYSGGLARRVSTAGRIVDDVTDVPIAGRMFVTVPEKPSYQINAYYDHLIMLRQNKQAGLLVNNEATILRDLELFENAVMQPFREKIRAAAEADDRDAIRKLYYQMGQRLNREGYTVDRGRRQQQ